jgi:hypothetical protein
MVERAPPRLRDPFHHDRHFTLADALGIERRARQIGLRDDSDAASIAIHDRHTTHLIVRHHVADIAHVVVGTAATGLAGDDVRDLYRASCEQRPAMNRIANSSWGSRS